MLAAFKQAFTTPDLRRKLLFSLFIMALFRLGSVIPSPGVSMRNVRQCIGQSQDAGLVSLINIFSGGALLQLSIFALGIMPYITLRLLSSCCEWLFLALRRCTRKAKLVKLN